MSLNRRVFGPGQAVRFRVRLRNLGSIPCGYAAGQNPVQVRQPFRVGPCSSLPLLVRDQRGNQVYPGAEAISCPAIFEPVLAPHGSLTAVGTWSRTEGGLRPARTPTEAPAGDYHLIVGTVSVPFRLKPPPPASSTARTP